MKQMHFSVITLTAALMLVALPAVANNETADLEDDIQALVRATIRLAESLERQETVDQSDRDLLQVQIAVQLLEIRVEQQSWLQERLASIENREQRVSGYIASNEIKLENTEKQLAQAIDESTKLELEAERDERMVYLKNRAGELDYLAQRRAMIQSRLLDGDRSLLATEAMVQDWLADVQDPPTARQGP